MSADSMAKTSVPASAEDGGFCALLGERLLIALSGPDTRDFLQRILTQDMAALSPERAVPAALLTPQGKLQHLFLLTPAEDGRILLETSRPECEAVMRLLTLYRLRARVEISVMEEAAVLVGTPAALAALREDLGAQAESVWVRDAREESRLARAYVMGAGAREQAAAACPGSGEGEARYRRVRAALGLAEGAQELPPGRLFALEANLDLIGAVSFAKGCYVGQEVTTRTHRRGRVKKRLVGLLVDARDGGPEADAEVVIEGGPRVPLGRVVAPARMGVCWALCGCDALSSYAQETAVACRIGDHAATLLIPERLARALGGGDGEKKGETRRG